MFRSVSFARPGTVAAAFAAAALVLGSGACAKSEDSGDTAAAGAAPAASQVVASAAPGAASCTLDRYGAAKLDLKTARVGFSQSEKEANPFRIAETRSIKDEAAALGITDLRTSNA